MKHERINIWDAEEYSYAGAYGFIPNLRTYLHDDSKPRPCVLVIPGGGYRMVSPTEGEIVAKCFYDQGYQAFVGTYTTNYLGMEPLGQQPLRDISRMVRTIRSHAEELKVSVQQVILCGFSAGAHLCGSLCVHWQDVDDKRYPDISNRPDGAILSYPVITAGKYAHRDSFTALLGETADEKELEYHSLETQVTANTPPIFMWQTATDELVPVENSYLMAKALRNAGVSFEHHVFPKGRHGLSLSNDDWAQGRYGEPYTMEQLLCTAQAIRRGDLAMPEGEPGLLGLFLYPEAAPKSPMLNEAVKEVSVWPELADQWIRSNT